MGDGESDAHAAQVLVAKLAGKDEEVEKKDGGLVYWGVMVPIDVLPGPAREVHMLTSASAEDDCCVDASAEGERCPEPRRSRAMPRCSHSRANSTTP